MDQILFDWAARVYGNPGLRKATRVLGGLEKAVGLYAGETMVGFTRVQY